MPTVDNKRIAKNTIILYLRMFVSLIVSLYTARIIFNTLGIENFGLYNVVASVIVFFSFINSGLTTATKRYITVEIGKGKDGKCQHIFNVSLQAHFLISIIVLVLSETIGLFIINYILNIPVNRIVAANYVFQISIIAAIIGISQSPYTSVIIAHEKMNIYAYFSIFDIVAKLLIIYLLKVIPGDKLIIYPTLTLGVSLISFFINLIYCNRTFIYTRLKKVSDPVLLKEIFKFMSWSLLGQVAVVGTNQGVSVLINVYYSVVVNAAMGISNSVTGIVSSFTSNFQIAFNPQIIKLYNTGELQDLKLLIIRAAKISSFLILIFLIPICFEIDHVLKLWLGNYPQYSPQFVILTIIAIYFESISTPLYMVIYSQTNIRTYQIIISSVYSLNFILGWIILALGASPYSVIIIRIIVFIALLFIRLNYLRRLICTFSITNFINDIILRGFAITLVVSIITYGAKLIISGESIFSLISICSLSCICSLISMFYIGLSSQEKIIVKQLVLAKIRKRN